MRKFFLLVVALFCFGCGSEDTSVSQTSPSTATLELRHTLLRGAVPAQVDELRITGLNAAGQVVFGPITRPKQPVVRVEGVPSAVVLVRVEYIDDGVMVGKGEEGVQLDPGELQVVEVTRPSIDLTERYTTLDVTIAPTAPSEKGYVKLDYGEGEPTLTREDLGASAQAGREQRRTSVACIAQISDTHVIDAESPLRCEYLRGEPGNRFVSQQDLQGSFRAQETLTTHVVDSMIRQLNGVARGPITGRAYDCLVSTGDNGDNRQSNEVNWFTTLLDGGTINPSSGNPSLYEGVQDKTSNPRFDTYYHPDSNTDDIYKRIYGFPDYPGLLEACTRPFTAEGSKTRWYTVYGNHDDLIFGNLPTRATTAPTNALNGIITGTQKNTDLPAFYQGNLLGFFADFFNLFGFWDQFIARGGPDFRMISANTPHRTVTADPQRKLIDPTDWARAHFNSPAVPGPVGHGLQSDSVSTGKLYYTFDVAPGVKGITMDTVNRAGYADGSLDKAQFDWLEQQLIANSSRYYDANGNLVTSSNPNSLIVLFSHHNSFTMNILLFDDDNPPPRFDGPAVLKLIRRFPNVVLWVNGHSHTCKVLAHPDPSGKTNGFWEVNTPSHVDYPQQSRIVEMVNNQDGTLSIFGTLVDHTAPPQTDPQKLDPLGLASISRELSANDNLLPRAGQIGTPGDRNVELLIKAPF